MNTTMILVGIALAVVGGRIGWLLACRKVIAETTAIQETIQKVNADVTEYDRQVCEEREATKLIVLKLIAEIERLSLELDNRNTTGTK